MKSFLNYFHKRQVVANVIMFASLILAILSWHKIGKEEMPEFAMQWIRLSISYPGTSAENVEFFVTKPIEEKLKSISGLADVKSTSSYGQSSMQIFFDAKDINLTEKIQEVKDAVASVSLPREADEPVYRQFRSSEKAIIDIGLYLDKAEILDVNNRAELQKYVLAFKNKILALPAVSGVDITGYLRPELQIKIIPEMLKKYELSMHQVKEQIIQQNIRKSAGNIIDKMESGVTIISELDNVESLNDTIISSGFATRKIKLSELANIEYGFEKNNKIIKLQGHEAVILNIKKNANIDILTAKAQIDDFVKEFSINNSSSNIKLILMDDESYDVKNRLELIGMNGLIGFALIILILFLFMDFRSGFWVAMGIPFALSFTLIICLFVGYSVNNITLAAIIIVLGIVVDDGIIIAENISRNYRLGVKNVTIAVSEVSSPIFASVITSCAAFIPLYFFDGRFGLLIKYIPLIIFLMLFASLVESFLILPTHVKPRKNNNSKFQHIRRKVTISVEIAYAKLLEKILGYRLIILCAFVILLVSSGYIFHNNFKYVMFPREESRDFRLKVVATENINRYEMAQKISAVENIFINDKYDVVKSVNSQIGQTRRGGEVRENEASIRVEITSASERKLSLNKLIKNWQKEVAKLEGFQEIKFQKGWFGSDGGSPIVIEIRENNDLFRQEITSELKGFMDNISDLTNVEIERPILKQEYLLEIREKEASDLGVSYERLASVLRSYIAGDILYTINSFDEELDIRFTSNDDSKSNIADILDLTVANKDNYLVPIGTVVNLRKVMKPVNISRNNYKRTTMIYADMSSSSMLTPLEIAEILENKFFPSINAKYPSAILQFKGEIEESRESAVNFFFAIIMTLIIIYILLVLLFNSFFIPLLIGAIIPFGAVGVIFAFWLHNMTQYGFFALIGSLGMIGVVINDSIVLVNKLKLHFDKGKINLRILSKKIANITSSRLKAVVATTVTSIAGLFPTAYGLMGYDSILAEMMLAMGWGLLFGMFVTLLLVPALFDVYIRIRLTLLKR
jgi:multidrug efflux pump subunit AcrB